MMNYAKGHFLRPSETVEVKCPGHEVGTTHEEPHKTRYLCYESKYYRYFEESCENFCLIN